MSVKEYLKCINIQDLTTGEIVRTLPIEHDKLINIELKLNEVELLFTIMDLLQNEHAACIKIGYKG